MTFTDPIGDMFTRIRNGQMRSLSSIQIPSSNFRTFKTVQFSNKWKKKLR